MSAEWEAENYSDTYRERVEELIDRKRQGETIVTDGETRAAAPVVDLMDALQASVKAARNHRPGNAKVSPLVPGDQGQGQEDQGGARAVPAAAHRSGGSPPRTCRRCPRPTWPSGPPLSASKAAPR
jgi:hypothetical protein